MFAQLLLTDNRCLHCSKIVPTKFGPPWVNWKAGSHGDEFVGARARSRNFGRVCLRFSRIQIRFADPELTTRFDFVAIPQVSATKPP